MIGKRMKKDQMNMNVSSGLPDKHSENKHLGCLPVFTRDMQNILSVVSGIAELTDDSRISVRQRQMYAAFIKKECQRLERVIMCMSDAGNLCNENAEFSLAPTHIDKVLEKIKIQMFESTGIAVNIKMQLRIPPIIVDEERLCTAFTILLDNLGTCISSNVITAELSPCEEHISLRLYWQKTDRCYSTTIPKQTCPVRSQLNVNPDGFSALGFSYAQIIIEAHEGKIWCIPDSLDTVSFFILLPYSS
jgi:nitrogen-specific signal transduction histidine kinase